MLVPILTIDGPSGSGKGTIARRVATALGFQLLDSGALYRLVALAGRQQGVAPDDQEGHARVARKLEVPRLVLIINKVPQSFDLDRVRKQVELAYGAQVAAVLPHSDEMMVLASAGIFVQQFPDNPVTISLRQAAELLIK